MADTNLLGYPENADKPKKAILDLLNKVIDVQQQKKHYVSVEMYNLVSDSDPMITIWVIEGGWSHEKKHDLHMDLHMDELGGTTYRLIMNYLDKLLSEGELNDVQV